jgi:hypothetical protein
LFSVGKLYFISVYFVKKCGKIGGKTAIFESEIAQNRGSVGKTGFFYEEMGEKRG